MRPEHRQAFGALMVGVGELYGRPMSPELLAIFWEGLSAFEFADVKEAVNLHVRNPDTGQFMPKIADVVKFIEGNTATQAMRAWAKVTDAMRLVGTYHSVVFDDALIHCVIADMGGWVALGSVKNEEIPFKAREFEKRYQGYKIRGPANHPRKLTGIFEQQNSMSGFRVQPPMLIGDRVLALNVYEGGAEKLAHFEPMRLLLPPVSEHVLD